MDDYTGMIIKVLIVVVVGAAILGIANTLFPELFTSVVQKINELFTQSSAT